MAEPARAVMSVVTSFFTTSTSSLTNEFRHWLEQWGARGAPARPVYWAAGQAPDWAPHSGRTRDL